MGEASRLSISARLEEVRHACDFVVEAAEAAGLDERAVYHCQMAVDEALTNIIEHGFSYQGDGNEIEVICRTTTDHFTITIIDTSPAFNPLEHDAPDPSAPLDSREPGGWGIYFINKLMDNVTYQRVGDRNHLTLFKQLPDATPAALPLAEAGDGFPFQRMEDQTVVISPEGRLDSNTSPKLEQALALQLDQGYTWVFVDMRGVEYIASSGLKVLVSGWRRAQDRGGNLILSGLQPRIVEILEMVGFDMLFQIHPTLDDALKARPNQG